MRKKLCTVLVTTLMIAVYFIGNAFGIEINEANFPDANLRSFISSVWDHGYSNSDGKWVGVHDGFLNATEITDVTSLNWDNPSSAQGIQYFPNLEQICCQRGSLTELNVSSFSNLENLFCDENNLTQLNVSSNTALIKLQCYSNKIESLNVSNNHALELLICVDNPLGKLDVSNNKKLQVLRCGSNDLKVLDVTNNELLTELECWSNHLTELDLSKNKRLTKVLLGVQEVNGLKVKKVPEGYQVCLKDYVSNLENLEIHRVGINDYKSGRILSYDGLTGNIIFDECPRTLHYFYRTHSPNNDLLYVEVKASMAVDVIERGKGKNLIIGGIEDNRYLDVNDNAITESSIADLSAKIYGKKGFVADGNSRLIVRVKTERPGNVEFSVKENIGVEIERLSDRAKVSGVHTTDIGAEEYQASAVLIAPEMYPAGNFPSQNFTVHVKFTADETGEEIPDDEKEMEEDIELEVHGAPVLLIHSFGAKATVENTFSENGSGVLPVLKGEGFKVFPFNYDGSIGVKENLGGMLFNSMFNEIFYIFEQNYIKKGIVCTKIDMVAHGMGGLMARWFCLYGDKNLADGNYYTVRSYGQGMARRIITIATPHRGTLWGNAMTGDWATVKQNAHLGFTNMAYVVLKALREKAVSGFLVEASEVSDKIWLLLNKAYGKA